MIKKIIFLPLVILNILLCLGFLVCGYSYIIPPAEHSTFTLVGLAFPFFAVGVILSMAFWIFVKWKYAFISLVSLILGYVPMHKYAPITPQTDEVDGCLKVLSYNVHGFNAPGCSNDTVTIGLIIDYLKKSDADIICLQESYLVPAREGILDGVYEYMETFSDPSTAIAVSVMSKYPITKVEEVPYESTGNLSACFHIKYKGQTLRLINNHLESVKFTMDDKEDFKRYMKGAIEDDDSSIVGTKRIANCLKKAAVIRQKQAESIVDLVGDNPRNTLVVGDFNDTPISYTHYLVNRKLTDCYAERGWLTGFSYENNGMFVRIDHAFCSSDFEVVKCYVDDAINYSDHHPLITYLRKKEN